MLARAISERIANLPQLNTEQDEQDPGWDAFEWLLDSESDDDARAVAPGGASRTLHDETRRLPGVHQELRRDAQPGDAGATGPTARIP